MSSTSNIDSLSVKEIDRRLLEEFGTRITGNRDRKVHILKCYIAREETHPMKFEFDVGGLAEDLKEKRKVFDNLDKSKWQHVSKMEKEDIPRYKL